MRMKARTWLLLRLLAALLVLAAAAAYLLRWPSGWSTVDLGVPRDELVAQIGSPTTDGGRVEGQFWVEQRHFARYELWVSFDTAGRVVAYTLDRRLGTAQHFYEQRLKGDIGGRFDRSPR
jgi:hypothetical protein